MNPISILAKDIWFLAALLVFLVGLVILFWCVDQLRRAATQTAKNLRAANPRGMNPQSEPSNMRPSSFAPQRIAEPMPVSPPPSPFANETSVMYSVLEEKFSELSKRISSLESRRDPSGDSGALQPLMKRLDDLEKEIENLRKFIAQAPVNRGGQDLSVLNEKVSTLQRMMESLVLETEAPKPT